MRNLLKGLLSRRRKDRESTGLDDSFYVYRVESPEGFRHVVSLLSHEFALASGLASEAIVGECIQPFEFGEAITAANFRPNRRFLEVLHDVIATEAPTIPALQAEARRQHTGAVAIIDGRTPTPTGTVPSHDVIGGFEVRDGTLVPGAYRPNMNHLLFSSDGLFQLHPILRARLLERLTKGATESRHSTD